MAFDSQGRMFVSSDLSGEIYVIARDESSNGTSGSSNTSPPNGSGKTSGAGRLVRGVGVLVFTAIAFFVAI